MAVHIGPLRRIVELGDVRSGALFDAGMAALTAYERQRRNPIANIGYQLGRRAAVYAYFDGDREDDRGEFLVALKAATMLLAALDAEEEGEG